MDDHIIIVEDDASLADLLCETFTRKGFVATLHREGAGAVEKVLQELPALVILDLMLPGQSGFDVLRALRSTWAGPILILTASNDPFDHVSGLELGADDYVGKPVLPNVLLARVRALLRRSRMSGGISPAKLCFGELEIITSAREARVSGRPVPISDSEFELLLFLARNAGRVVGREELYRELKGINYDGSDRGIDLRVSRLRASLREHLRHRVPIRSVHGQVYLFAVD